ncbi:MAG: LysM peptidoglycan-binding domain-containing protein [Bacteroidales bacterium]|nr:LysM peptidoglycan-binding domain-containing protein [Bacteroidales bacterium]
MKKLAYQSFLIVIFCVLLSTTSCKIVEKYTSSFNKENDTPTQNKTIVENTEENVSEEGFIDEETSTYYEEEDIYENAFTDSDVIDDMLDPIMADSLEMALQERIDSENSGEAIVQESDIMMGMIDDLQDIKYFEDNRLESSSKSENIYNYPAAFVPSFPDSVYAERIARLRSQTTMELVYNKHVKSFIDVYAVQKRDHTCRILGLADIYFPLFEETLDKYDMPLEIKYLAVVESALNPRAGSHAGAKGLWQFMYGTGKVYKLNVTSLVDDRFDPIKATEAACQHLQDLYETFGDWFLALAAYNSGAGNVNKAIRRAGGLKNYWAVWPFLPKETRGYVPAFIAVNYVMNYSQEHNLYPTDPGIMANGVDSVTVHQPLHFDQLHEMLNIPMEDIKFFNPQYKASIIPASAKTPMSLRLPEQYINSFIDNEKELYAFKTKKGIDREKLEEEMKKVSDRSVHIVKSGESLGSIAKKYRISVNQLKTWNNLKSTTIYPGQKLIVYSSGAPMAQAGNSNPVTRSTEQTIHVVKSGENLSLIAKKYKCTVTDLKNWNNLKSTTLSIGQKLKVYPPAEGSSSSGSSKVVHTVKSGDNLWDISRKYGVSVEQIRKLNGLSSNAVLKIGQKLVIRN